MVWYEDVRSVQARLDLVREYNLAGVSWWTVNQLFRAGLRLQEDNFTAIKIL